MSVTSSTLSSKRRLQRTYKMLHMPACYICHDYEIESWRSISFAESSKGNLRRYLNGVVLKLGCLCARDDLELFVPSVKFIKFKRHDSKNQRTVSEYKQQDDDYTNEYRKITGTTDRRHV